MCELALCLVHSLPPSGGQCATTYTATHNTPPTTTHHQDKLLDKVNEDITEILNEALSVHIRGIDLILEELFANE